MDFSGGGSEILVGQGFQLYDTSVCQSYQQKRGIKKLKSTIGGVLAGFTLAETLITLGIIGVVAALVMPAQITKYQKNTTVEKLKKVMSELNPAMKISQTANGDYSEWTKPDSNFTYDDFSNQYLIPYMKVSKICSTHSS